MVVHLPREEGFGITPRTKKGPALAGHGAVKMKDALVATMSGLPLQLRRSLTWDRGKELSAHVVFKVETGIPVYFADPHSPWQPREHQPAAASILPQRHRPVPLDHGRDRGRRHHTQQPASKDPGLEGTSRGLQRTSTISPKTRCCLD
jgi:hypothetical protein